MGPIAMLRSGRQILADGGPRSTAQERDARVYPAYSKLLFLSKIDVAARPVENWLKKKLDTCSSVIVNYNSDWQH
jgi:hypothetical protein